jgi:hypothetical protein
VSKRLIVDDRKGRFVIIALKGEPLDVEKNDLKSKV